MPPKSIITKLVGYLMAAQRACYPYNAETADLSTVMFYSSQQNQFGLDGSWTTTFKEMVAKCNVWLDQYPFQEFVRFLQTAVADAKEAAANPAETSTILQKKVEEFFNQICAAPEWEVVNAVFGLAAAQAPFTIGPCHFFIMDQAAVRRWGQRRRCGQYDPPPDTLPLHHSFGLDHQLLGNWVGCLRVRAIDPTHATIKAKFRLEEVLNILRHGAFSWSIPQQCVRAGVGHPHYWNHQSMCIRVHPSGGFQDSAGEGADGLSIEVCSLFSLFSRSWKPLQTLVAKEVISRTSLEKTVMTALEWVGQAAAAVLGPVRFVSLVTALEVLMIAESETFGKRSKLSKRAARIVPSVQSEAKDIEQTVDRLYKVRSECLHEGATQVEEDDVKTAYSFVDSIVMAFLTTDPFCKCRSLTEVLDTIPEPAGEFVYTI